MSVSINIDGPDGNAFALLGYVKSYGKQLGWDAEKIKSVQTEMMKSDYAHLVDTFNEAFDGIVVAESQSEDF